MSAPLVFDRSCLRQRLSKAYHKAYPDFLTCWAAQEMMVRLALVSRDFRTVLDCGTPDGVVSQVLHNRHVLRMGPALNAPGALLVGDEEQLPFQAHSFDLAVSLLALHAVNDLPGALVQLRQALKPDGLFLGCLLAGSSLTELRQCFLEAESEITGGISPRVAPFADLRDLGALLQRAGFALPVADSEILTVRYATPFALMQDLRAMGWSNALVQRSKNPLRRAVLMRTAALYAQRFSDADGRIRATFECAWLSGWAPHESQQKPLEPGSAKMRLAEALKTSERPLKR